RCQQCVEREWLCDEVRKCRIGGSRHAAARRKERDNLRARMFRENSGQLGTGIAGGTNNRYTFGFSRSFHGIQPHPFYARTRRGTMPAICCTCCAKVVAEAGCRNATKIVSSPPTVPSASSGGVASSALATGWAAAGGVFNTTRFPAPSAKITDSR